MLAKFGFVLLILLFGVFAFVGGTMAPDSWREPIAHGGQHVLDWLPGVASSANEPAHSTSIAAAAKPVSVGSAAEPAHSATAPIALNSLIVTASVNPAAPAKGAPVYALQVGQFISDDQASAAIERFQVQGLGLPLQKLAVTDNQNTPWTIVAIGEFTSVALAREAAPRVEVALEVPNPPVIQLPPPAPAAAAAAETAPASPAATASPAVPAASASTAIPPTPATPSPAAA